MMRSGSAGRTDLHRRLGVAGGVLAALVIVLGVMIAVHGARNGWMPGGGFPNALGFLSVTLGGLLWPAITRIPYVRGQLLPMFGLMVLFVVAGPVHDLITRRPVHPVYVWGGLLILASFPLRRVIGMSDTWQGVAGWLVG